MEGVPRIPMMSFPMRRSADTPHFKARLKSFISSHYNEDPDSYANEIHELESLRASAVHVSKDFTGCSTLKKYFCQLNFLKSRFPMNEGGTCSVSFSWYDVFSDNVHGWSDVDFEMSCVLYNVGALHSELGALDNRQTADGMKTSCTHFQCAAGAFSHLRHNYQKYFTPDVSPDMLNILNNVCLGQAQECIFEKSLIDNRKSTITAKVALQIVEYYSTALRIIDGMLKDAAQYSDKLIKAVKKWRKLVELKVHYYGCIAYLYRGMQAEDQSKWGERVTLYKAAAEKLAECQKLAKNMEKTDPIHDTLHFTQDVVGGKVAIAEKENEFIYHEKVPDLEAVMSDVKAVSLVKGIQFKFDDPQVAGPDIFGRLVPMEAHEASSLYSEEKAKILRTYSRKIEEKNEALDKFILPLQLDQLELHDSDKIPQELVDCCAALSVNQDAVKRLSELMARLSSLFHDVEANLEEIQDHLDDQEKREKEYQQVVGVRPPNNIISEIHKEFQKYQSAQSVAAESNKTLHEAMVMHVSNLQILMKPLPEVMNHIPKFDELEKNEEALERMKKLAGKVGEMRKQREMLESQLRDSIMNDDITKSLVVKKDEDLDTVFKEELQKHDKITTVLDQNLLAQENIIRALMEANAEYAETRKATVDLKRKRDAAIQGFISSYEAYDELTSKCNKGIEFYQKLSSNVEKLLQRMRSVCKVQNEERDINMERIIRKAQIPGVPVGAGVVPPTSYANNTMMSHVPVPGGGGVGGYYPPPTTNVNVNVPPKPGYPSSSSPPITSFPKPTGTHLKLKDYLAMKKEGLQTPPVAPAPQVPQVPETTSSYGGPTSAYNNAGGLPGGYPNQNAYYPTSVAQYPQQPQPPVASTPPAPAPAPAPISNPSASQPHPPQPQQQMNSVPAPSSAPSSQYYSAVYHPTANTATNATYSVGPHMSIPTPAPTQQQQSVVVPPTSLGAVPMSYPAPQSVQHQQPQPQPSYPSPAPTPPQQHQAPVQPQPQPQQQPHASAFATVHPQHHHHQPQPYVPSSNSPYQPVHHNQNQFQQPQPQVPASYQQPVPSSVGYPYNQPNQVPPPQQQQMQRPPVNYSTPPPPQSQPQPQVQSSQINQAPVNPTPNPYQAQAPVSSSIHPPQQPQPQQQQQQRPSTSFDEVDYSQTSFLAQYVRQNQGYLSSKSAPQPTSMASFPSSVNYNSFSQMNQQDPNPIGPYSSLNYSAGHGQVPQSQAQAPPQPQQQQPSYGQNGHGQYNQYGSHQQQQAQWGQQPQQQQPQAQQYPQQYPQASSQPQQNSSGYYSNSSQSQAQYPQPQSQPSQPPQFQAQQMPKSVGGSNLDLLSDIDFNVSVQPLVPSPAPANQNNQVPAAGNNGL